MIKHASFKKYILNQLDQLSLDTSGGKLVNHRGQCIDAIASQSEDKDVEEKDLMR